MVTPSNGVFSVGTVVMGGVAFVEREDMTITKVFVPGNPSNITDQHVAVLKLSGSSNLSSFNITSGISVLYQEDSISKNAYIPVGGISIDQGDTIVVMGLRGGNLNVANSSNSFEWINQLGSFTVANQSIPFYGFGVIMISLKTKQLILFKMLLRLQFR